MFFSIIIASYNRASRIKLTLESILKQTFKDLEIIVVDDGSDDNTEEVVTSIVDTRIRYIKSKKNEERGAARNFGIGFSLGEYINFFDSDDIFTSDLNAINDFIEGNLRPAVVYGDIGHVTQEGLKLPADLPPFESFSDNLLHNNFLACGSVFLRRDVADKYYFNESRELSSAEDWELWLRIHSQYAFTHIPLMIFQQVQHNERSLATLSPQRIEVRDNLFANLVKTNEHLVTFYGRSRVRLFVSDRLTFIALNWCDIDNSKAFEYWSMSLASSIKVLGRKRFWAVLKKLIIR